MSFLAALGPAVDALAYLEEDKRTVAALVKMADFFAENGYCFACNRLLDRCQCEEPLRRQAPRTA